jgi:ribosome-binding factor A
MKSRKGQAPSQRQLRVGEELRHQLALIVERGELRDPGLAGKSLTVTEVSVSPDLRNATAFVAPLGGGDAEEIIEPLQRAAPFLRRRLARSVRLKYTPQLTFAADKSFDNAAHIENLLDRAKIRDGLGAQSPGKDEAGGRGGT